MTAPSFPPAWRMLGQRWRLLCPVGAPVVHGRDGKIGEVRLRMLPAGAPAVLVGRRGLRRLARRGRCRTGVEYLVVPSLSLPVLVVRCEPTILRWSARHVLAASGDTTGSHVPLSVLAALARLAPGVLTLRGDRILIAERRP